MMWPCTTFPWLWDDVTALWRHVTYHASCDNSSHTSYNSQPSSTHTHHIIYRTFQFSYRTLILYMTLLHYHNTYINYIIISLHLTLSWHLYYYIITLNITLSLHLHYIFITLIISHCIIITLLLLFNILIFTYRTFHHILVDIRIIRVDIRIIRVDIRIMRVVARVIFSLYTFTSHKSHP